MKPVIVPLFSLTVFLAAILLFSVEPMIGKMVLPLFGGTPAVWTTCLLYFQMMLVCGYALSGSIPTVAGIEPRHTSTPFLIGLWAFLVVGSMMQPIRVAVDSAASPAPGDNPTLSLLWALIISASGPVLIVSATSPLVQLWFGGTGHPRAHDPYFLYAASNAGSLAALMAYPLVIEPNLSLAAQGRAWKMGFLVLAILMTTCGVLARVLGRTHRSSRVGPGLAPTAALAMVDGTAGPQTPLTSASWIRWLVLVFVPSSWLMGVTTYLTTDLAPMPLLWVIPLALYLLSFILAFDSATGLALVRLAARALPMVVLPLVLVMSAGFVHAFWIPLHLLAFFIGSLACHGALAHRRPAARHLAAFYVMISLGGLLGGVFNAMIAPVVFDRIVEYPLAVVLACGIAPGFPKRPGRGTRNPWLGDLLLPGTVFLLAALLTTNQGGLADSALGVVAMMIAAGLGIYACATAPRRPARFALVAAAGLIAGGLSQGPSGRLLHIERNFFGVVRVTEDPVQNVHRLFHGSTLHGQQSLDPAASREPSTYFTRSGPIGQVFAALRTRLEQPGTSVAIVGLGVGTLASYASPGQRWTFYEIDPAVARIARDPRFFTYLRDCEAKTLQLVLGDARLRLGEAPDQAYRLLVLDAFSSDSLPVHLVSREAIGLYRAKLAAGGVLAFNLSNRYLDLGPMMGRQARDASLVCRIGSDTAVTDEEKSIGRQPSIWAVMAASEDDLGSLASDPRWRPPADLANSRVWTDDYSDVARHLRLLPRWLGPKQSRAAPSIAIEGDPSR